MRPPALFLATLGVAGVTSMTATAQPAGPFEPAAPAALVRDPVAILARVDAPPTARPLKHTQSFIAVRPDTAAIARAVPGDTILLRVDDATLLPVRIERVKERTPTRRSLAGYVEGAAFSSVLLVLEDDALAGDVRLPDRARHWRLRYVADGVHLVCRIDDSGFADCGGASQAPPVPGQNDDPVPDEPSPPPPPGYTPRGSCANIETTFDVMVVYSDIARAAAGGTSAIRAEIQLGCDTANLTYDNSGVAAHYRLVWQGEVVYDENGPMTAHRDRLYNAADGYYDWVPSTKDAYNADLCSIWVDDDDNGSWCGFALCSFTGAAAYCSVNWECAAGNFSFPHEHGHNQGCDHNTEDAGSCSEYTYSYGHRFFASGTGYRTVMAYNNDASQYTRVGYWSNPAVSFMGVATGSATHNNAASLNNTRATVEGWELTRYDIWIDADPVLPSTQNGTFVFPYDTAAEGFNAIEVPHASVSEIPVLHAVTGQYNYAGTVSKKMTITACSGAATIGTP